MKTDTWLFVYLEGLTAGVKVCLGMDCNPRQCLLPGLQELTLQAVTSVLIFALLLLSNLILPAAEDCAHWLLAVLAVGGIFFSIK